MNGNNSTWRVPPEGMSQMFRVLFLGNGMADCVETWYALGDPLVTAYAVVTGKVLLHVRTRAEIPPHRASVSRKRLGRLCSNLVCWLRVITKCLPQVMGGVYLHVRTCARAHPFSINVPRSAYCYLVTVGPIALKFGMHLETH